ncbi:MAG: 23S rRNA (uracil(1939)-C(5))-methyltransferase RlmD [Bacteroidales bacterium]|nr:23S rRNA (uracil(1939)-C(5))-methyltransferase RlmD [Bacteroidales bacterium]
MARKKQEYPVAEKVEILDAGSEGKSIGKIEEKVVFVPFVVPGDVVDVKILKKKKSYFVGKPVHFHTYSSQRTEPRCEHFGTCGGCRWQNMQYESQLHYKQKQVEDNLQRIAKVKLPEIRSILPSPKIFFYRNKLHFTFSNRRWLTEYSRDISFEDRNMNGLGFHMSSMFDRVLDLDNCYLQPEPSNSLRLAVKKYAEEHNLDFYDVRNSSGFLRNLVVRNTTAGEWMAIMVFNYRDEDPIEGIMEFIRTNFPQINSLNYVINQKVNDCINDLPVYLYAGKPYITEVMNGLQFRIGPMSFFQTNSEQALVMYEKALEFAGLQGGEIVYDLYTGTGTIANFVARSSSKVVGIEYIKTAVDDAKVNSEINDITNTVFYSGDIAKIMDDAFIARNGRADVVITDPPRAGMHEKVVRQILKINPEKIVYISCNPATQARDVAILDENYQVEIVQPVDMFPHTHHVENIILLRRR